MAAAVQVAADLQANLGNKARLVLPVFQGKNDAHATRNFIDKVDGYATVTRLSTEEAAQAVAFAMQPGSPADLWLANLKVTDHANTLTWLLLKPLLLARFSPALTASEKAAVVDACRQGKHEDVQTFKDQCETVQILLDRDMDDAMKTAGNLANYRLQFSKSVLGLFLRGLREDQGLKSHVNASLNCTTLADYADSATRYERHITKAIKVTVAELNQSGEADSEDGESDEEREVAILRARQAAKKKSNGSNAKKGNGNGKAKAIRTSAAPQRGPGGPRLCWTCQSSNHLNRDCPEKTTTRTNGQGGGGGGGGPSINELLMNAGREALLQQYQRKMQYNHNQQMGQIDALALECEARNNANPGPGFW